MNITQRMVVLLLLVAAVFTAQSTAAAASGEWRMLFDGHSLAGWRSLKSETPGAGWKVEDGTLVPRDKPGDLVTIAEFGDFELSLQWKVTEAANSGVIYRVGLGESATYRTGPEYQVLDNAKADDNKQPNHLAGALYDLAGATKDYTRPVGEWNDTRIVVRGWHVQHWLNGEKVVDVDLKSPEGKRLIAASKFKDWPAFASLDRGRIALQDHGYVVGFRTIKIRELK
jgi:hypothetical protein